MRIHNLYTYASGQSHFRDIEVEWVEERRGSKLSKRLPANGIIFRETQAEHDIDWHLAPRRQYIINLDARVKITASDGEPRDRHRRSDSGRGHDRQRPLVAACRGEDPAFGLRSGRIARRSLTFNRRPVNAWRRRERAGAGRTGNRQSPGGRPRADI